MSAVPPLAQIADRLAADADVAAEVMAEARSTLRVTIVEQHALLQLLATLSARLKARHAELREAVAQLEVTVSLGRIGLL